jgi:hypothetical protein
MSLYNPSRNVSIKGFNIDYVEKSIKDSYSSIIDTMREYEFFCRIRDKVNSTETIYFTNMINDSEMEVYTISEILFLLSPMVKEYHFNFINKIKSDIEYCENALGTYNEKIMSTDKVDAYVLSRLNTSSTNLSEALKDPSVYSSLSDEYMSYNKFEIYDPLNLMDFINDLDRSINYFYNNINSKLRRFNYETRIKVDRENLSWELIK